MDCLHLAKEKYKIYDVKKKEFGDETEGMVAWFTRHDDSQTGTPCLAKARTMPENFPKLLEYFPHGFCPLTFSRGLQDYFRVLESLRGNNV